MIYNIYKPMGWTSFDVVKKIRSITKEKKVGHAGTLDPFAEGVLIVGTGIDTKSLESDLWDRIYSKIPGVKDVANKSNFIKNKEVTKLYVDHYVENETEANELYREMLVVCREHMCDVLNKMNIKDFIDWVLSLIHI